MPDVRLAGAAVLCGIVLIAGPATAQETEHYFLDPMGPIARAQRSELIWAAAIILIATLPVIVCTPWVFWRYRRSNPKSTYTPDWAFNTKLELVQWGVPLAIVIALSIWLAQAVYLLDPYRSIDDDVAERLDVAVTGPPVTVDVIGLDWKWLYLYPELGVASVGDLVIPVGRPVEMRLTSDTVMQSFMAPGLAGQIYAMAGMRTRLSLLADRTGTSVAENTQYNGPGFARQRARVQAMDAESFERWVEEAAETEELDVDAYHRLAQSTDLDEVRDMFGRMPGGPVTFSLTEPRLFDRVMARYLSGTPVPPEQQPGSPVYDPDAAILPEPLAMGMMGGME